MLSARDSIETDARLPPSQILEAWIEVVVLWGLALAAAVHYGRLVIAGIEVPDAFVTLCGTAYISEFFMVHSGVAIGSTLEHQELFPEWKSLRYFNKYVAGEESGRHLVIWEYESLTAFEEYKKRRANYEGPYEEYKVNDPYYKGVFDHSRMKMEFWNDVDRDMWIE